jgi:hypothetical protein
MPVLPYGEVDPVKTDLRGPFRERLAFEKLQVLGKIETFSGPDTSAGCDGGTASRPAVPRSVLREILAGSDILYVYCLNVDLNGMTRRDLLHDIGLSLAVPKLLSSATASQADALPGTQPLTWARQKYWKRDLSSRAAYEKSIEPNRSRFLKQIGVVDVRPTVTVERFSDDDNPALVAETDAYRVYQVRWPALEGVFAEGLLLEPKSSPAGYVVALPDADQTPEQIAGIAPGITPESQFARRLVENRFEVLIPVLIDRTSRWSGHPDIRMTDQPHREWIYRQSFHMGRHIIGYEVQKCSPLMTGFMASAGESGRSEWPVTPKVD